LKITGVTLTLFAWDGLPAARYAAQSKVEAGSGALGLLTLETDEGLAGHAFLGSALYPADVDGDPSSHAAVFSKPAAPSPRRRSARRLSRGPISS
jgi:hypothetical protein